MSIDEFELTEIERRILDVVSSRTGRGRHCAKNGVNHLRLSWKLRKLDPAMAVFRGITAEEEVASAMFYALTRLQYRGARRLRHTSHEQKTAVRPFVETVLEYFSNFSEFEPTVALKKAPSPGKAVVRFAVRDESGGRFWIEPDPPLNFLVSQDGQEHKFHKSIEPLLRDLASRRNHATFKRFLEERKNERNRLLYATDNGYPVVTELSESYYQDLRRVLFRHLLLYLLIDQSRSRQRFVQQGLDAFLDVIGLSI